MKKLLLLLAFVPATTQITKASQFPKLPKISSAQEKCLATTIYGEARGETLAGQVAVAYTLLNRAKNKSICNVALAPKQYSVFNNNPKLRAVATTLHLLPEQKNIIDKKSWNQSIYVAKIVMSGLMADPTNGATHYLAPTLMSIKKYRYPKWSTKFTIVANIDNHKFYKAS